MRYNSNEIQKIIPHRYPFQLVDRIVEGEEGKYAKGIKAVCANEWFFCGHFPQEHVMPGVLIIEALAQVGAIALLSKAENRGKLALFAGIRQAKFRGIVKPGDLLEMECELTKMRGALGVGKASAKVEGKMLCEAEIMFALQKNQKEVL